MIMISQSAVVILAFMSCGMSPLTEAKELGLKFQGLLSSFPNPSRSRDELYRQSSALSASSVDWSQTAAITRVKKQGKCESCSALATADAIGSMWALRNGQGKLQLKANPSASLYALSASAQQIGDCSTLDSCSGGSPDWDLSYAVLNGGLALEDTYPYTGMTQKCNVALAKHVNIPVTGWERVPAGNVAALKKAVSIQPVIVMLSVSGDFENYSGGVYSGSCDTVVNHVALVVGYGYDEASKQEFWKVKNSWGEEWGEFGYIRMAISNTSSGTCGITSLPSLTPAYHPANATDCSTFFPPLCGGGTCSSAGSTLTCTCPEGFISRSGADGLPSCAPATSCAARGSQACGAKGGACVDLPGGDFTCNCTAPLVLGSMADGSPSCTPVATYTAASSDTCRTVAARFLLSENTMQSLNPSVVCHGQPELPAGLVLTVSKPSLPSQASPSCKRLYTVKHGDSCESIYLNAHLSLESLLELNPGLLALCRPNALTVGQQLCVGSRATEPLQHRNKANSVSSSSTLPVLVQAGDTVASIAAQYASRCHNISAAAIRAANHLGDSVRLAVGTELLVPCTALSFGFGVPGQNVALGSRKMCGCSSTFQPTCGLDNQLYTNYCQADCEVGGQGSKPGLCKCSYTCKGRLTLQTDCSALRVSTDPFEKEMCCSAPNDCRLGFFMYGVTASCWRSYQTCRYNCGIAAQAYQHDILNAGGNPTSYTFGNTFNACLDECWTQRWQSEFACPHNPPYSWE